MTNLVFRSRTIALASAAMLALTAAACPRARNPSTQTAAGHVSGTWLHREMPVRYMEAMTLQVRGDSVLGEGTYSMEAGRQGNTTIVGKLEHGGTDLRLDILRDTGVRERWAGTLRGDTLSGTLKIADTDSQPFNFVRQP
ncbi:MAG TPA: hypothetical protein VFJ82_26250 [Longimicrobium sp.]|nr:hypothetical protein [Longimicrobium sp.]